MFGFLLLEEAFTFWPVLWEVAFGCATELSAPSFLLCLLAGHGTLDFPICECTQVPTSLTKGKIHSWVPDILHVKGIPNTKYPKCWREDLVTLVQGHLLSLRSPSPDCAPASELPSFRSQLYLISQLSVTQASSCLESDNQSSVSGEKLAKSWSPGQGRAAPRRAQAPALQEV